MQVKGKKKKEQQRVLKRKDTKPPQTGSRWSDAEMKRVGDNAPAGNAEPVKRRRVSWSWCRGGNNPPLPPVRVSLRLEGPEVRTDYFQQSHSVAAAL